MKISSGIGIGYAVFFPEEYVNADYVIDFYFDLINKMRRNLIKIRSWAISGGLYG